MTEPIPVDRGDRLIWLLDQVQAPLLYIIGILVTASLLITLQATDFPFNLIRPRKVSPDEAGEEAEEGAQAGEQVPSEEYVAMSDLWRTAKFVIVIIVSVIALGFLLATLDPTSTPDAIAVVVYYTVLVILYLIYLVRVINRYRAFKTRKNRIAPEQVLAISTLDVVVIGFTVFFSWIIYIAMFGFFGHRDPTVAAFILVIPVAPIVGFLTIIRDIIRTGLHHRQSPQR